MTGPANRAIPTGDYTLELTGYNGCNESTTPGNLLLFKPPGVEMRLRVTSSTPDRATVTILSATYTSTVTDGDALDRWEETTLSFEWREQVTGGPAFVARTGFSCNSTGCAGTVTHALRRTPTGVECEFAMLWLLGNASGFPGSCRVTG